MVAVAVPFLSEIQQPNDVEQEIPFGYVPGFYGNMEAPYVEQDMDVDDRAGAEMVGSKSAVRSCTTCSKAKAKCVKRPDQQICER